MIAPARRRRGSGTWGLQGEPAGRAAAAAPRAASSLPQPQSCARCCAGLLLCSLRVHHSCGHAPAVQPLAQELQPTQPCLQRQLGCRWLGRGRGRGRGFGWRGAAAAAPAEAGQGRSLLQQAHKCAHRGVRVAADCRRAGWPCCRSSGRARWCSSGSGRQCGGAAKARVSGAVAAGPGRPRPACAATISIQRKGQHICKQGKGAPAAAAAGGLNAFPH